jgi:heme exporter protein B
VSRYLAQVGALVRKEIAVEARTREGILAGTVFALLVLVIFNFALDVHLDQAPLLAPGVLWVAVTFAGVISLGRGFARERDRQTLEGLLLAPMDRSALFLAKVVASLLSMLLVVGVSLAASIALFNLRIDLPRAVLVLVLGSVGLAGVGTLFAAVAAHTRARDVLLPLLLLPVQVPVILATVKATAATIQGTDTGDSANWLGLLVAFDGIFFGLSLILFDYAIESD